MQLIPEWQKVWRTYSAQAMALAMAVQLAWAANPEAFKALIPPQYAPWITVAVLVFGMLGRVIKQGPPADAADTVPMGRAP